jgi:hypothetical protein
VLDEKWDLQIVRWLIDHDDENIFRRWAMDNRYGDSAYAFRRLLELAELRKRSDDV